MTLQEAEKQFGLPRSVLEKYISFGLIRKTSIPDEYRDEDFERLGLIDTLLGAGFTPEEAKRYLLLTESKGTDEQQLSMLKKRRRFLLEDIHKKQRFLDSIDYMIWVKTGRLKPEKISVRRRKGNALYWNDCSSKDCEPGIHEGKC